MYITRNDHKIYVKVFNPIIRIVLFNIVNSIKGAYLVSKNQPFKYMVGKTCEGDGVIDIENPKELHGEKNYCVCLELVEEEQIFEEIKG